MRVAFTGGGTGGHVFPNVAVINEIRERVGSKTNTPHLPSPTSHIFYIGGTSSLEEKIVVQHGIPFFGIHTGKLRRYWDLQNLIDVFKIPLGIAESYRVLKREKPDLVFAKGGYVSVPVAIAARLLKIPVWLHESDVSPGLATRLCSAFAQKIFLSFEESKKFFPRAKHVEVVGNPIRAQILKGSREAGYKLTGFSPNFPVILVMGGSTGAAWLNRLVEKTLPQLAKLAQLIHVTGEKQEARSKKQEIHPGYIRFEFLNENLAHIYAITDLAVSRAGSGSIFELLALGKPMILIPLPKSVSRGDQIENARACEERGFARMLEQEALTPAKFLKAVSEMLARKPAHAKNAELHKFKNAAAKIADEIVFNFK